VTFSVIVPVRNGSKTLSLCLQSLRNAGGADTEIIVVDDDSDDESPEIAAEYADTVIRLTCCAGASSARNSGAEQSCGDIIVFVDSDVVVPDHAFNALKDSFQSSAAPDAVQGIYARNCPYTNPASQYKNLYYHFIWTHLVKSEWLNSAASFFLAVKREVFEEIGGFDTQIIVPTVEDAEWGHRAVRAGKRILQNREIQVIHYREYSVRGLLFYDYRLSMAKMKFLLRRMFQAKDGSFFCFDGGFAVSTARAVDMIPWLVSLLILPLSLFLCIGGLILPGLIVLIASLTMQTPFFLYIRRIMGIKRTGAMIAIMFLDILSVDAGIVSGILSFICGKRY